MSDFTVKKKITKNFTVIQNEIFDADLSIDTIGLYLFLFSLPDDWKLNVAHLKRKFGIGKARVYRMLNELIETGYVERVEVRNEAGQFTSLHYQVNDSLQGVSPQPEEPLTENRDAGNRDAYKELTIPRTNSIKKNTKKEKLETEFEKFWNTYPNKKGRSPTLKAFEKYVKAKKATFDELITASVNYAKVKKGEKDFLYSGYNFINQGHWEDYKTSESKPAVGISIAKPLPEADPFAGWN